MCRYYVQMKMLVDCVLLFVTTKHAWLNEKTEFISSSILRMRSSRDLENPRSERTANSKTSKTFQLENVLSEIKGFDSQRLKSKVGKKNWTWP